ncbi:MAG TPA: hypothetical protein VFN56_04125 [Candidatus Saccharimonadales bacterium]|nr:hypothetical protein [Candidatus Saccharimonadales bacterium]
MPLPEDAKLLTLCSPQELNQGMKAFMQGTSAAAAWLLDELDSGTIVAERFSDVALACSAAYQASQRLGAEAEQIVDAAWQREAHLASLRRARHAAYLAGRTMLKGVYQGLQYCPWSMLLPPVPPAGENEAL